MRHAPALRTASRWAAPACLLALGIAGGLNPSPDHHQTEGAWPSLAHPLGLDYMGRDFVAVLAAGAANFVLPGLLAVGLLLAACAALSLWALGRPVLETRGGSTGAGLAASAPPRLLIVMIGMLMLEEPSPWFAALLVTALYLPVARSEVSTHLRALAEQEVLAGSIAHGLPTGRLLTRHLFRGHLREPLIRHCAALFLQVAFTQIALAYMFGSSSVTAGLGVSWGMEFKRLGERVPGPSGSACLPDVVCQASVATLHAGLLLLASLILLGALLRLAAPATEVRQ